MASGGEEEDFSWLSSYFSQLVAQAREHWIPLETAREFLTRGAKKAVDIIYNAVGPVGPPIRPGSGSLFIVDERRLHAWREDGYDYETLAGHVATSHTSTLPVGSGLVVVEWSKVKHPPQLQRRAIRLPKIQLTVAAASANPDAGWIWLVHYLSDVGLPPWLPAHMRPEAPVDLSLTTPVKSNAPAVATTAGPVLLQASPPYTVQEEEEEEEAEEEASTFDGVEDMYGSVEQFVQLTEEELRAQVAAAESLIKKSLQLRMGHAVAEPVQQVDEEDAASWRDERSRSSRTSDIPTDSMLDGDDVREDEEDGQQQYYEDTESETEYSKAQLYMGDEDDAAESGSPGSAGHAYPTYSPQSSEDVDQPQYARASAPMWTMDVTGRMVPLPYSPNIPLEAGGNEARADAMRRRQQLFNSVSSVGQDEASLARASAGDSPASLLGGTPRHAMLRPDGRLSPQLRNVTEQRVSQAMAKRTMQRLGPSSPQGVEGVNLSFPSDVSLDGPSQGFDTSKLSSIADMLVSANERTQAVAPVSPTRAPVPGVFPPPPSSSASPYWVLAVDPATRRLFYHDVNSGVSTWVPPKEFEEAFAPPPPPPRLPSVSPPAPAPLLPREGNPHGGSGIAPPSPHNPRQSAASVPDPFLPQPLLSREPPASSVFPPAPALEFIPSTAVAAIPPVAAQIQLQPQASTLQQQVSIYPAQLQVRPPSLPEKPSRRKHSSRRHRRPSPSSSSSSSPSSSPSTRSSSGSSRSRRRRRRKHKSKRKEGKKKRGGKTERRSSRHRRDRTRSPSPPSPRPPRAHSPSLSLVEAFPGHIPFESTHRHTVSMPIGPLEGYPPAAPPTARFLRPTASEGVSGSVGVPMSAAEMFAQRQQQLFAQQQAKLAAQQREVEDDGRLSFAGHERDGNMSINGDDAGSYMFDGSPEVTQRAWATADRIAARPSPAATGTLPVPSGRIPGETPIARRWREAQEAAAASAGSLSPGAPASPPLPPPSPGDTIPIRVRKSPKSPARSPPPEILEFLSGPLGDRFIARLRALRLRKLLRTKKYRTLVAQVRDTRQAISDCRAGLNDAVDVDGGDGFLESLTAQLAALQEELWAVFVDGGPDRVEKELALARRAATRASAGRFLKAGRGSAAVTVPQEKPAPEVKLEDAPPVRRFPRRVPSQSALPATVDEVEVKEAAAPAAKPKPARPSKGAAPAAASKEAKAPALGQSLKPSGAWRVVVELISARDLPPSSRLAQGPGMVASEGKSAAHEVVDGRDCYAEAYIARPVTAKAGRKLGPAEDGDGDGGNPKVKVIGRKVVTGTDLCTLTPQWDKKFVLVVPPRLVYDAAQALHARDSDFREPLSPEQCADTSQFQLDELLTHTNILLHVDVLDADRFSKDMFLGQIVLPLQLLPIGTPVAKWYPLGRRSSKDKVRGDVRLQCVLVPPEPALAAKQYQSFSSTPSDPFATTAGGGGGGGGERRSRIEELARAKSVRPKRPESAPRSLSPTKDGEGEEVAPTFLRAKSRRPRVVPPPVRVDYSKVQPKTISRQSKASLSPPRRGGTGVTHSKVSRIQIDLSKVTAGAPAPADPPRMRSTSNGKRPDISSEAFLSKLVKQRAASPTEQWADGVPDSLPISVLRAAVSSPSSSSKRPPGVPRAALPRAHRPSDEGLAEGTEQERAQWHQQLRGGTERPVKDSLRRRSGSDAQDVPEILPSGAVEFTSDAWDNDELWMSTRPEGLPASYTGPPATSRGLVPPLPSAADSLRFAEVDAYFKEQRRVSGGGAKATGGVSASGVAPYIPLHKARQDARGSNRTARVMDGTFGGPATGDSSAALDALHDDLAVLRGKGARGGGGEERRQGERREGERERPRSPLSRPSAQAVDMDFVALQKVFEDMLSQDEPPDYEDFLKRTSFLPRAPSPPRAALRTAANNFKSKIPVPDSYAAKYGRQ